MNEVFVPWVALAVTVLLFGSLLLLVVYVQSLLGEIAHPRAEEEAHCMEAGETQTQGHGVNVWAAVREFVRLVKAARRRGYFTLFPREQNAGDRIGILTATFQTRHDALVFAAKWAFEFLFVASLALVAWLLSVQCQPGKQAFGWAAGSAFLALWSSLLRLWIHLVIDTLPGAQRADLKKWTVFMVLMVVQSVACASLSRAKSFCQDKEVLLTSSVVGYLCIVINLYMALLLLYSDSYVRVIQGRHRN